MKKKIELKDAQPGDLFTGTYAGVRVENSPLHRDFVGALVASGDKTPSRMFDVVFPDRSAADGIEVESITREIPDLPTEPGLYLDCYNTIWKNNGHIWSIGGTSPKFSNDNFHDVEFIQERAPLTRLLPEGTETEQIADWLEHEGLSAQAHSLRTGNWKTESSDDSEN